MTDSTMNLPLMPAEQNRWYLLATLYGAPRWSHDALHEKNRITWNRYHALYWSEETRSRLRGRIADLELTPLNKQELEETLKQFNKRIVKEIIEMPKPNEVSDFRNLKFTHEINFGGYIFNDSYFDNSIFEKYTRFNGAIFSGIVGFRKAIFENSVDFSNTKYVNYASFDETNFGWHVDFSNTNFSDDVDFRDAKFNNLGIFTNAEFKAPTNFAGCRFERHPPKFPGAKLHEGTIWRGVSWPRPPATPDGASLFIDAYERLKLEMDRLKKHEDELMFFAKELECRRVEAGQFRGLPIGIYGVLCHYGQSYLRPLGWLVVMILIGAVQFWPALGWDFPLSLAVSAANALGPFGLRKELLDPEALKGLSRWLQLLTGAQMVLGPVLLFLIGLGLRNRFRMK